MRNKSATASWMFLCGILLMMSFTSCINTRKAVYFNNIGDGSITNNFQDYEPVIQKNDLLSISVTSLNPEASVIFNAPNFTTPGVAVSAQATGYLVDEDGSIRFPVLGSIPAKGLTKKQLTTNITKELQDKKLLVDPIVNIRFLNYRVTVLGEVKNPSVVIVPNEKISLMEAIGLAGDLTIYAKRDNVLIIREVAGKKVIKRVDLTSPEILSSPYYYLQSNDVVYVEPNKARVASSGRAPIYLPIIVSTLSLIVITASYFRYR
jgi:polysaccharide export outer membrane protein